ncbi:hypothetical protein K469DRAFT_597162, partial [Zopfia rhizophila CBS 207.26]
GKTEWAVRVRSRPIVISGQWNLRKYDPHATHVVLNDVDFATFGAGKHVYWREVLGCQKQFEASDRYSRTRSVRWGFPVVVTCNRNNDPRLVPAVRRFLEHAPYVIIELSCSLFE